VLHTSCAAYILYSYASACAYVTTVPPTSCYRYQSSWQPANGLSHYHLDEAAVWLGWVIADTRNGNKSTTRDTLAGLDGVTQAPGRDLHFEDDDLWCGRNPVSNGLMNHSGFGMPRLGASTTSDLARDLALAAPVSDAADFMEPRDLPGNDAIPVSISFRIETKKIYICTHGYCNKKYSRMPDLRCHYRGAHLDDRFFKCRARGCERAVRGFPRRDKRDAHEQKMHVDLGEKFLL
jgi:hypothetical protein